MKENVTTCLSHSGFCDFWFVFFGVILETRLGLCLCSAAELRPSPESHCVAQAGLELLIFLPLPPKYLITPHRRLSETTLVLCCIYPRDVLVMYPP